MQELAHVLTALCWDLVPEAVKQASIPTAGLHRAAQGSQEQRQGAGQGHAQVWLTLYDWQVSLCCNSP